jgi:FixJ family two-component response regulator
MTDVVMPETNGRDLAKYLPSLYSHIKRMLALVYTTRQISSPTTGVLDDTVHFIQKPFTRNDLAAKVREATAATVRAASMQCNWSSGEPIAVSRVLPMISPMPC